MVFSMLKWHLELQVLKEWTCIYEWKLQTKQVGTYNTLTNKPHVLSTRVTGRTLKFKKWSVSVLSRSNYSAKFILFNSNRLWYPKAKRQTNVSVQRNFCASLNILDQKHTLTNISLTPNYWTKHKIFIFHLLILTRNKRTTKSRVSETE